MNESDVVPTADPGPDDPDAPGFVYDEFGHFDENCAEFGLDWDGSADVRRIGTGLRGGGTLSGLRWGTGPVRIVFLHGGAQNAHTWDTVALALRPTAVLAVDLPGHGRSSWRDDGRYDPSTNAEAVTELLEGLLDQPVVLVGMSLGGLTANRVAAQRPGLVERLVIIDITPGVTRDKAKEITDFIAGPQSFGSFSEIFERTVEFNPTRSASSLRRGILHNAHRNDDGTWQWNYHRAQHDPEGFPVGEELWGDVAATQMPYLLARGANSPVVDDEDVAELLRRRPEARVEVVSDAGHSIQGDQPLVLARMLEDELREMELEPGLGPS